MMISSQSQAAFPQVEKVKTYI